MTPIKTETVKTDGIVMPCAQIGSGEKNLLILPGLSIKQVTPMAEAVGTQYQGFLDNGYTIWIFDRRTNAPEGYSIWDMADDTAAVMGFLGIETATVFGASQGGMIAQCLAITHSERVQRLILGSTLSKHTPAFDEVVNTWIGLAEERDEEGLIESFGSYVYSPKAWRKFREGVTAANRGITEEEYNRFILMAGTMFDFDCAYRLEEITCPAFVIGAQGDRVTGPDPLRAIAEKLHCKIYVYGKSYGHGVFDEAPDCPVRMLEFCEEAEEE